MGNNLYILYIVALISILFFLSSFKVVKVKLKFSDLTDEQKQKIRKKKPVAYWKASLGTSFDKYSTDMKELINWWRENEKYVVYGFDKVILRVTPASCIDIFNKSVSKLTRANTIITFIKLKIYGEEKLTKKYFYKDIQELYYHRNILKYGKERLQELISNNKLDLIFTDELLDKAKVN